MTSLLTKTGKVSEDGEKTGPRFQVWVASSIDGTPRGGCPFSARIILFLRLKLPATEYVLKPVRLDNKPQDFLDLNPKGDVPYLVDLHTGEKLGGSADITKYIEKIYPKPDLRTSYNGPAMEATDMLFSRFVQLVKFVDEANIPQLKTSLDKEHRRINMYLRSSARGGTKYLIADELKDIDCKLIPQLHQIQVGGAWFQKYSIPLEYDALWEYIKLTDEHKDWLALKPADEDIIRAWAKFNVQRSMFKKAIACMRKT